MEVCRLKTLKTRLQKKIEPCYLIQGEDILLYDKALELIKKATNIQLEEFNFLSFDDESFNGDVVIDSCETLPMGSDKKLILLKNITKIPHNLRRSIFSVVVHFRNVNISSSVFFALVAPAMN